MYQSTSHLQEPMYIGTSMWLGPPYVSAVTTCTCCSMRSRQHGLHSLCTHATLHFSKCFNHNILKCLTFCILDCSSGQSFDFVTYLHLCWDGLYNHKNKYSIFNAWVNIVDEVNLHRVLNYKIIFSLIFLNSKCIANDSIFFPRPAWNLQADI